MTDQNMVFAMKFNGERLENIVEKGGNAAYQHLHFQQYFPKPSSSGLFKCGMCSKGLNDPAKKGFRKHGKKRKCWLPTFTSYSHNASTLSKKKIEQSQSAAYPHTAPCNRIGVILWKKISWKCLNCWKNHYTYKGH